MRNKRGLGLPADYMGWMILGISILVVVILISIGLKGKLVGGIDFFKNLMRFGG